MSRKKLPSYITANTPKSDLILHEKYNSNKIFKVLYGENSYVIRWLAEHRLIENECICIKCGAKMNLTKIKGKKLGHRWICTGSCRSFSSVLYNSYFTDMKLNFNELFRFIYEWSKSSLLVNCAEEAEISETTGVELAKDLREVCIIRMLAEIQTLGGLNEDRSSKIVKIDESLFWKRKYNRGRVRDQQWVVGMLERGSTKCILIPVKNRTSETLLGLISAFVLPGTIIITDGWKGYSNLIGDPNYQHFTVIHEYNFISPENPIIHTQGIESTWAHAKRKLRYQFGTREEYLESYLFEFIFRKYFANKKIFNEVIYTIAEYF